MYLRLTIALLALVLLAGTHWKAYVEGKSTVRAELQAQALKASEAARKREQALRNNVGKLDRELQEQKARNAALDRAHAERLREYEDALSRATAAAPAAPSRADGPFARIAGECGAALVALDQHARGLEARVRGLQDYTSKVCVNPER